MTVRVTEALGASSTKSLEITIDALPAPVVSTTTLPEGIVDVSYGIQMLAATGGDGSYTWALASGSGPLPTGLSLAANG